MSAKAKKGQADASRFEGSGLSYKAKLIGVETVPEARGDQMCQETITKLKNEVKGSGQHKQKIFINVTLEGLKIIDAISLTANQNKKKPAKVNDENKENQNEDSPKEEEAAALHIHPVHRISFISRDTTDNRAFGYIYGDGDGTHKFFAIKTAAAAEQLVLALRDLFTAVYEMKKKEVEEAKEKIEKGEVSVSEGGSAENSQTSGLGSTSGAGQTPQSPSADSENIYQVPPNNAPARAEDAANLLDLEDQAEHILKGIEQIKNLEFDSIIEDGSTSPVSPPTSPMSQLTARTAQLVTTDPWGTPPAAVPAAGTSSSALGDLAGLQTSPFPTMMGQPGMGQPGMGQPGMGQPGMGQPGMGHPGMGQPGMGHPGMGQPGMGQPGMGQPGMGQPGMGQQGFPGSPFSPTSGGFGTQPSFPQMSGGLPVSQDPFGNDPFRARAPAPVSQPVGAFNSANPFGTQAFGMQQQQPQRPAAHVGLAMPGMMPGTMPGAMPQQMMAQPQQGMMGNPFAAQQPPQLNNAFGAPPNPTADPNLLVPIRQVAETEPLRVRPNSPKVDLFSDLVNIKTTAQPAATPRDMFAQLKNTEKKSMNQLKSGPGVPGQPQDSSPFGDAFAAQPPAQPVNGSAEDLQPIDHWLTNRNGSKAQTNSGTLLD